VIAGSHCLTASFDDPAILVLDNTKEMCIENRDFKQVIAPGAARRYVTAGGSSTRGGSTSVRGRVRSPHVTKQQATSVPTAYGSGAMGQTDGRIALSLNAPYGGGYKNRATVPLRKTLYR